MSAVIRPSHRNPELAPVFGKAVESVTKREKYGWKVRDRPGRFAMIDKDELHVDPDYQRPANQTKARAIAGEWSWIACGTISVVERDGIFYVVEGQHRVLGATLRDDIRELPCMIYEVHSVQEEAEGFIATNVNRTPVLAFDRYRASVVAADPAATLVREMLEATGHILEKKNYVAGGPNNIVMCPATLINYARQHPDVFRKTWPLVADVCRSVPVKDAVVRSLMYIQVALSKADPDARGLDGEPWKGKLLRLGGDGIEAAGEEAVRFLKKHGAKSLALGVLTALNKGMRTRKLVVPGLESGF